MTISKQADVQSGRRRFLSESPSCTDNAAKAANAGAGAELSAAASIERRSLAVWLCTFLLLTAALLWPALWNGFPLIFPDTGGYLARPFEGRLEMGRSAFYGAMLAVAIRYDFFPIILLQATLIAWLLIRTAQFLGLDCRPLRILGIGVALAVITGLPWCTTQLIPDALAGVAVLSLYLLAFHTKRLALWERIAIVAGVAMSAASHMSILALTLGLLLALTAILPLAARLRMSGPELRWPVVAVAASLLGGPVSNLATVGQFQFTPGGSNFLFARMVNDGIAAQVLASLCPDHTIRLCDFRNDLPPNGEDWLWDSNSPLNRPGGIGGRAEFEAEAARLVRESIALNPLQHLSSSAKSAARQFVMVATGDGLNEWTWHTEWILRSYAPSALAPYLAARQRAQSWNFTSVNIIHAPVAWIAIAILPFIAFAAGRQKSHPVSALALIVLVTLAGNAAICGIFSIPHDRYQSRLVWLAPFTALLAVATLSASARRPKSRTGGGAGA
jgi:hypothetical protein